MNKLTANTPLISIALLNETMVAQGEHRQVLDTNRENLRDTVSMLNQEAQKVAGCDLFKQPRKKSGDGRYYVEHRAIKRDKLSLCETACKPVVEVSPKIKVKPTRKVLTLPKAV